MVDTITTDLDPVPSRSAPSTFSSRMDTWLGKISTWTDEANALATGANTNKLAAEAAQTAAEAAETNAEAAKNIAQSAASYAGVWSGLTGSLSIPSSVYHSGSFWILLNDLVDVTSSEPSIANADWEEGIGETFTGKTFDECVFLDHSYTFVDKGNSGTTTQTLDYTGGSHQKITCTGAHTIVTSNWPPTGFLGEMLLELVNGGAFTITWPTINWIKIDGTTTTTFGENGITLQTSGTDFIVLWSRDAGTTIYGKAVR